MSSLNLKSSDTQWPSENVYVHATGFDLYIPYDRKMRSLLERWYTYPKEYKQYARMYNLIGNYYLLPNGCWFLRKYPFQQENDAAYCTNKKQRQTQIE